MRPGARVAGIFLMCAIACSHLSAAQCGSRKSVSLLTSGATSAGTVTIANDPSRLVITYTTINDAWAITAVHLAVAESVAGIPRYESENPIPEHFLYQNFFDPPVHTIALPVPLDKLKPGMTVYVAAQAEVRESGGEQEPQAAWGQGPRFNNHNPATYIAYQVQPCGKIGG